eukprot:g1400.t1
MLLKASCSGLGLGGSLWSLACYGLCVVVGASAKVARLPDLEALTVADVVVLLGGISRHPSRDVQQQLTDAAKEVAVVLQSRGNVLVPLNGSPEDFTEELTECIAKAISELENQGPIFAISTPARSLRRCGRWAEWTSKKGQERARVGEHPFLVDALRESGRLVLAETINDLTDAYEEPCVVLAPISLKRHFEKLWDSQKASRRLCWLDVQGVLPGVGNAIQPYISATELARTWSSCARPPKKGRVPLPPELTSCKAVELMVLDSGLLETTWQWHENRDANGRQMCYLYMAPSLATPGRGSHHASQKPSSWLGLWRSRPFRMPCGKRGCRAAPRPKMIDAYPGYYSPNESIEYSSHRGGIFSDFIRASMNDCKILCFEIRRYLHVCFDRDFLASAASRRDLWRMLLPLPGIMALVADSGNHELMLMDATLPGAGMRTPVTMGSGGMKAKELSLSKPEMQMREIILFLLGLPVETRETLEEAENYTFTMSHRAPPWSPESHLESKLVTFEGDTVSCARLLANSGLRVAMLNFAHGYNCGGGFEHAAVEHADFVEIALRFLAALHSRSFRPGGENFDKQWQLQEALNRPVEHDQRQRLLSICLGQRDLSVPLSAELSECFFRAVGRQLHLFEGWTMFNLQELMHWDGGMRRLKDGITSWTIPTLRCQMLPQKIFLQPLLLAKKWGLHFQHSLAKVPGSMWGLILAYLTPPRISWFETVQQRQNHPWWDWPRHPLVFPMLTPSSPPLLASSVVGISIFQGEGSAEDCTLARRGARPRGKEVMTGMDVQSILRRYPARIR